MVGLDLSIASIAAVNSMDTSALQQSLQDALATATSDGNVGGYETETGSTGTVDEPLVGKFCFVLFFK